jgi:hypothetical protein
MFLFMNKKKRYVFANKVEIGFYIKLAKLLLTCNLVHDLPFILC